MIAYLSNYDCLCAYVLLSLCYGTCTYVRNYDCNNDISYTLFTKHVKRCHNAFLIDPSISTLPLNPIKISFMESLVEG